ACRKASPDQGQGSLLRLLELPELQLHDEHARTRQDDSTARRSHPRRGEREAARTEFPRQGGIRQATRERTSQEGQLRRGRRRPVRVHFRTALDFYLRLSVCWNEQNGWPSRFTAAGVGKMQNYDKLYINGGWTPSCGGGFIDVINASTEAVMGRVPEGTPEDIDRAVTAARAAFETWGQTSVDER